MDNIVADAAAVKLEEEAEIIRRECAAADEVGLCRIYHAIEAGKHANQVKNCIPRRFRRWLRVEKVESDPSGKGTTLFKKALSHIRAADALNASQTAAAADISEAAACPGIESGQYRTIVLDTVTAAARLCFRWLSAQPEGFSERTGKPDTRGAYGLHAREFLLALHHLQGARTLNIVLIGALETTTDDYGRIEHHLQAEGQRVPREIAGIVDSVLTMNWLDFGDGKPALRGFVCNSPNFWRFPAKDRSGKLEMIEPPDLGALIRKVLRRQANHFSAAHDIQLDQQQG